MIVITLTKVPKSLSGDLTKWYQEIQTGVYVGNVSARIRDMLWDRIMKNIGHGEATMVYNANNEFGYQFRTTRKDREVIDFDGIPLMMHLNEANGSVKHGFSDAAKFHKAKVMTRKVSRKPHRSSTPAMVTVDLETTGLDPTKDEIISIGAVKQENGDKAEQFYKLVKIERSVPPKITELTKITSEMLKSDGVDLASSMQDLRDFVGDNVIIGYNLRFDEAFLTNGVRKIGQPDFANRMLDLMPVVKKANKFLDNYRLQTVMDEYDIKNEEPHNSLADAQATFELATKLMENGTFEI